MKSASPLIIALTACALLLAACSGDSAPESDLLDRLTQQAAPSPQTSQTAAPTSPTSTSPVPQSTTAAPSASPDAATVLQVRTLGTLVLTEQDLPPGFVAQNRQGAFRDDIIAAQQGVPPLADFLTASSLRGSWAVLFTHDGPPPVAQSSIIYLFADASDAAAFVAANVALDVNDYLGATDVEPLPSPDVGDTSSLIRFTTAEGGSLELTWAQGPMAGQLILRYSGEDQPPEAAENITALAQIQAERMVSFLPR